jgi:CubicO group peptidase (beta-lactamase class C family)
LSLDDMAGELLPALGVESGITLRQLLNHTSGLYNVSSHTCPHSSRSRPRRGHPRTTSPSCRHPTSGPVPAGGTPTPISLSRA